MEVTVACLVLQESLELSMGKASELQKRAVEAQEARAQAEKILMEERSSNKVLLAQVREQLVAANVRLYVLGGGGG